MGFICRLPSRLPPEAGVVRRYDRFQQVACAGFHAGSRHVKGLYRLVLRYEGYYLLDYTRLTGWARIGAAYTPNGDGCGDAGASLICSTGIRWHLPLPSSSNGELRL